MIKKSNMMQGISAQGMVLTDMPLDQLIAMRDAIDDIINQQRRNLRAAQLTNNIQAAIMAAEKEGYQLMFNPKNGQVFLEEEEEELEDDYDDDDDDDWWDEDDDDDWDEDEDEEDW